MNEPEFDQSKTFNLVDSIAYAPHAVVIKTLIKKITGNVCVLAFDAGETFSDMFSPFDNFIQVIDGRAEIIINGIPNHLKTGQSIIIPAHSHNTLTAKVRFKMLSTIIKSGYEDAF